MPILDDAIAEDVEIFNVLIGSFSQFVVVENGLALVQIVDEDGNLYSMQLYKRCRLYKEILLVSMSDATRIFSGVHLHIHNMSALSYSVVYVYTLLLMKCVFLTARKKDPGSSMLLSYLILLQLQK